MRTVFLIWLTAIFVFGKDKISQSKEKNNNENNLIESKELIAVSQNLLLQKDRVQAILILQRALVSEKNQKIQAEIKKILKDIGSLFLSEKAQQEYEAAINFRAHDKSKWREAITRAEKIEPDNTLIWYEKMRDLNFKQEIKTLKEAYNEMKGINPFDRNFLLIKAHKKLIGIEDLELKNSKQMENIELEKSEITLISISILEAIKEKDSTLANENIKVMKKMDPSYPMLRALNEIIKNGFKNIPNDLCEPITERQMRKYNDELFLCDAALLKNL